MTPHSDRPLDLTERERSSVLAAVTELAQRHLASVGDRSVTPTMATEAIRAALETYDFERPVLPERAIADVIELLEKGIVHTSHPRYFGLFNPAPAFMGVAADALTAAFNPQLAATSHAPAAVEIEQYVLRFMGERLGFPSASVAGTFTSGGAEANATAVLTALARQAPDYIRAGARALQGPPKLYASAESHGSLVKTAHACGLGRDAVRLLPVDAAFRLDAGRLHDSIARDRVDGALPFMVIGTAGTTSSGAIDPLHELADICEAEGLWFHADAAWGGAAAMSDRLRPLLRGIERADSVTVDAHKWLSVPMGAGMFLCRDDRALGAAFDVQATYMPGRSSETADPYVRGFQWSRRFIGLKLFLSLAVAGREGYARQIERDCRLGDELRQALESSGWHPVNSTELPVVCFVDAARPDDAAVHRAIVDDVVSVGRAWISAATLGPRLTIRACITNFRSSSSDVRALVRELDAARARSG